MPKIRVKKGPLASWKSWLAIAVFAMLGTYLLVASRAAPGVCSTANVVGSVSHTISIPETGSYRLWVRMQVPSADNANNLNGVRVELAEGQCFTVTTTSQGAVNQWQWINSDATQASTPHVTGTLNAGTNVSAKILGLKDNVKVDRILLLPQDSTCIPSNDFSVGQPGDNCNVPSPTLSFTSASQVASGTAATLTWSSTNATTCTASGGWSGTKATSGSESTGALTSNRTYTLTCVGVNGSAASSVTITVTSTPATKVGDLNGDNAVSLADLAILLSNYGKRVTGTNRGDFNGDGSVTFSDLALLLSRYGK